MKLTEAVESLGRPVAYYPQIARWLGGDVSVAVFLCQFLYWRKRVGERQIYKSRAEIEAETAISERVQKRLCKQLSERGLITIEKKGMPARNYYTFHWEEIDKQFEAWTSKHGPTSEDESSRLVSTDGTDKSVPMVPTTSETTSETTRESADASPPTGTKKEKHPTLHVPISRKRYDTLAKKYGTETVDSYIQRILDYCAAKGKRYKDYAAAAANWIDKDEREDKGPPKAQPAVVFDEARQVYVRA